MDQNSIPNSVVPAQTTIPEEDATLLAIEALEARSIDQSPRPLNAPNTPRDIHVAPRQAVIPPARRKVIGPVVVKATAPAPKPVVPPPAPITPPKPKKPLTLSEAIAEALASAPVSRSFQFFTNHSAPRKPFIIIGIIVVVIGAGVAAYFTTR